MSTTPTQAPEVVVRRLGKAFPGTVALKGVDLEIPAGEIRGLVGGNGSGKSTLIKILAGVHQGEPGGEVEIGGERIAAEDMTPAAAYAAGVRVVHQDIGIVPDLTVAENIALGATWPKLAGPTINRRALRRRAQELLDRFEISARPGTVMRRLSRAVQTEVAIARALQDQDEQRRGLLILDEPTAALADADVQILLASLRRSAARGQTIIFISHRLDEVLGFTDRVSVLRDGELVGTRDTAELDETSLYELIVGREYIAPPTRSAPAAVGTPMLEVEGLAVGPLREVDLTVRAGEVVGVAGLLGSGRTELLRAIFGDLRPTAGRVKLDGAEVRFRDARAAMAAGLAFVPEDRRQASFHDYSVEWNMAIANLGRFWRAGRVDRGRIRAEAGTAMTDFGVKASSSRALMSTLSGGNQQKVILARWLRRDPRLLLLDEPTQGVDIGARNEIYELVRAAVDGGAAAIVVASDLEEMVHAVDRVLILRGGRIVAEMSRGDFDAHTLNETIYMEGQHR
jgi:ribose transport system ATP-binding protein